MPKVPAKWNTNTSIGTVDTYDSTGSYDGGGSASAFDTYDGMPAGQSLVTIKKPQIWATTAKSPMKWVLDPNATLAYNTAIAYDSINFYDGNPSSITTKVPTKWGNV